MKTVFCCPISSVDLSNLVLDPILRVMTQKHTIPRVVVTLFFLLGLAAVALVLPVRSADESVVASSVSPPIPQKEIQEQFERLVDVDKWVVLDSEEDALEQLFVQSSTEEIAGGAVQHLVAQKVNHWPAGYRREFLSGLSAEAIVSGVENQLPPSVTLAQAVLESGWGRSGLARRHNNLFGVKSGSTDDGVLMTTYEGGGGDRTVQKSRFRRYGDWSESLAHHNRLLGSDRRYQTARIAWRDWRAFVDEMAPVYATDPAYVTHLSQLVRKYELDSWDDLVARRVEFQGR